MLTATLPLATSFSKTLSSVESFVTRAGGAVPVADCPTRKHLAPSKQHLCGQGAGPDGNCQGILDSSNRGCRAGAAPSKRYNLYAILALGYWLRSPRGVQFRCWVSLRRKLVKTFVRSNKTFLTSKFPRRCVVNLAAQLLLLERRRGDGHHPAAQRTVPS